MNTIRKTIITILSLAVLPACGGGGGGSTSARNSTLQADGKRPTVDVKYTFNGNKRPTCHNANDIGKLNPKNDDFVECTWYCGRYGDIKGRESATIWVSLMFRKSERTDEGIWELTNEYTVEASPIVCRDY